MRCNKCGSMNNDSDKFCNHCGSPLNSNINQVQYNNTQNIYNKNNNDNFANMGLIISSLLCIGSIFLRVGILWLVIISALVFPMIQKGLNSSQVKKAKIARILLIIFIIWQIVYNVLALTNIF